MTDAKPDQHWFPMTIIQHAVWLYHRFPLSDRALQALLHVRATLFSPRREREGRRRVRRPFCPRTPMRRLLLREWRMKSGSWFAEDLRHREPRRGSGTHLIDVWTTVDRIRHCLVLARTDAPGHAWPLEGRGRVRFRARHCVSDIETLRLPRPS